jgi:hypothetical protein
MESEEERAVDITWNRYPYLRLYEDAECYCRRVNLKESVNGWIDPRVYIVLRFFDSVKGFYTVRANDCFLILHI